MARKTFTEGGYLLTPSTKTLVIQNKIILLERLVLITNERTNQVIYNFSDPSLRATSLTTYGAGQLTAQVTGATTTGTAVTFTAANTFTPGQIITITGAVPNSFNLTGVVVTAATSTTFTVASTVTGTFVQGGQVAANENTVIVLNATTAAMFATDKLQIVIDEFNERINPSEELTDPVGKLRISEPQALIDTDFEYGTQASKWETTTTTNLRPYAAHQLFNQLPISDMQTGAAGTKTITVTQTTTTVATTATGVQGNGTFMYYTTAAAHNINAGQWVTVTGVTASGYNTTSGIPALVLAVPSSTTFVIAGSTTGQSTGAGTVTINVAPPIGTPVLISDTYNLGANGNYQVTGRASETSWSYVSRGSTPTGWASQTIFDANKTVVATGPYYKDAFLIGASAFTNSGQVVTVTTSTPHGLSVGNEIAVHGSTASTNAPNGNYAVTAVNSPTVFQYVADATPTGTIAHNPLTTTATAAIGASFLTCASVANVLVGMPVAGSGIPSGTVVTGVQGTIVSLSQTVTAALSTTTINFFTAIYARAQGQVIHRSFDGGVLFSSNAGSNNVSLVRQTRRYFRYQSGKGIQVSSGTILKPTISLDSLTVSGALVAAKTKERHNLQPGYIVNISGANENGYNGNFTVVGVTGLDTFTYAPTSTPAVSPATGNATLAVDTWSGGTARLGIFDQQNGMFFEYDGQALYAVRRSSTFQIAGRVSVTNNSSTVAQFNAATTPTLFTKQLVPGDFIVIRGQSYRIDNIASDTSMTITPPYRGSTANNVIVSKTVDVRTPQSAWNLDKADGTGASGYRLDLTKMQMFYLDYSWYGAGSIRWGFRGPRGEVVYCHKVQNNNVNSSAYMRSGNLPARYEAVAQPATTQTTATVGSADATLNVSDTTGFYRPVTATTTCTGTNGQSTIVVASTTNITVGMFVNISNVTAGTVVTAISGTTLTLSAANTGAVSGSVTFSSYPGNATIRNGSTTEIVTYTGLTSNTITGVTRAGTGNTSLALTIAVGSNVATVSSAANLQVGQRIVSPVFAEGTKIEYIQGTTLVLSSAPTTANPTVIIPPLSPTGQTFTYSATAPTTVEQAFPTFAPIISHWGTSVIMDGRFDDDKSLNFTYGQTVPTQLAPLAGTTATGTTSGSSVTVTLSASNTNIVPGMYVTDAGTAVPRGTYVVSVTSGTVIVLNNAVSLASTALTFSGASTKALLSIRISPSIDNGVPAAFGAREIINRTQLQLRALGVSLLSTTTGNVLVQAFLNGTPFNPLSTSNLLWTDAIRGQRFTPNSTFAQIADYSTIAATGSPVVLQGGEVTGGFLTNATTTLNLSDVRDLGNSILGGGGPYVNNGVYPDGPDTLTIVVTNVSTTAQQVIGRLTWTEAQA